MTASLTDAANYVRTKATGEVQVAGQIGSPLAIPPFQFIQPLSAFSPTIAPPKEALSNPIVGRADHLAPSAPPPLPRSAIAGEDISVSLPPVGPNVNVAQDDQQSDRSSEDAAASGRTQFDLSRKAVETFREEAVKRPKSIDALKSSAETIFDLWLKENDPEERQRHANSFMKLGDELRNEIRFTEADPVRQGALKTVKNDVWETRRVAIGLTKTTEFKEMTGLALTPPQKQKVVELLVKLTGKSESEAVAIGRMLGPLIKNDFTNTSPDIEELFRAQLWLSDLSTRYSQDEIEYEDTVTASGHARYRSEAATARRRGEIILTDGVTQRMPQQHRNTCSYNAVCNLFGAEIAAGRLKSKDVLSEALKRNPRFASRSRNGGLDEHALSNDEISQVVEGLAKRLGKRVISVAPNDLIRFMRAQKLPVLATIFSGNYGHAMVVGNPFVANKPEGGREVVFETFDANYPKGVAGYIEAGQLKRLMTQRFPLQPSNISIAIVNPNQK